MFDCIIGETIPKKENGKRAHPHLTVYFTGVTFPFNIVTFEKKTLQFLLSCFEYMFWFHCYQFGYKK